MSPEKISINITNGDARKLVELFDSYDSRTDLDARIAIDNALKILRVEIFGDDDETIEVQLSIEGAAALIRNVYEFGSGRTPEVYAAVGRFQEAVTNQGFCWNDQNELVSFDGDGEE